MWKSFVHKEKLKAFKWALKAWNHHVFSNLDSYIESLRMVVSYLDLRIEQGGIFEEYVVTRIKAPLGLWSLLRFKDSILVQRSRARWLKERDANTDFFHACIISKSRRSAVLALKVGVVWVEGVSEIFQFVVDHFFNQFRELYGDRSRLHEISFCSIFVEDNANLTVYFLLSEIDQGISLL